LLHLLNQSIHKLIDIEKWKEAGRKSFQEFAETHFLPPICSLVLLNCRRKCGDGCCCICNETHLCAAHKIFPESLRNKNSSLSGKFANFDSASLNSGS
jgi:hypothetical protein